MNTNVNEYLNYTSCQNMQSNSSLFPLFLPLRDMLTHVCTVTYENSFNAATGISVHVNS